MFNIPEYAKLISSYKGNFNTFEKILVALSVILLVIIVIVIILLLVMLIRKLIRRYDKDINKDSLLSEIADLNKEVARLMKERDEIMAMKVSQLGVNPEEESEDTEAGDEEEQEEGDLSIRFPKLASIDAELGESKPKNYDNSYTLPELIDNFRCYSASQLKLYYDFEILRPFFAGLACGKLIILQGISGTGKTSLAYAWGKFVEQDSCVSSVEPSWKDKSDFLGYFNEFTKKFNETRALGEIYEAGFDDDVHTIILDEMNLARV